MMAQHLQNLDILLHSSNERTVYLTEISKNENHTYTEDGRADISFSYKTKIITESSDKYFMSIGSTSVRFIPDKAGLYKIEETNVGRTHYQKGKSPNDEDVFMWQPGIRETSPLPITYFVGYSNDNTLVPVKILRILEERTVVKKIYDTDELDEEPSLTFDGEKLNLEKYIKEELKKNQGEFALKNVSGFITFKYVVDENGWISDVSLDKFKINKKEAVPLTCSGINSAITKYYYLNDQHHRWKAGKISGIPVAARQYVTIRFN